MTTDGDWRRPAGAEELEAAELGTGRPERRSTGREATVATSGWRGWRPAAMESGRPETERGRPEMEEGRERRRTAVAAGARRQDAGGAAAAMASAGKKKKKGTSCTCKRKP